MISAYSVALSEGELRAQFKCSQFFDFGGTIESDISNRMVQTATEYYFSARLRTPQKDHAFLITKAITRASKICELDLKYMSGQRNNLVNTTALWLDSMLQKFNPNMYLPITGPLPWRTTVSKTAIDLKLSAVLRTPKNQTLHVICFSPFGDRHSQINDPVMHLKADALKGFVKVNFRRPRAIMHILWIKQTGALGYDFISNQSLNPEYLNIIERKVKQIERKEFYPLYPCPHQCKFKKQCNIGGLE